MTTTIPVLPYSNSVNATVEMNFVTVANESEGGIASRKSVRTLKRVYTLTIGPNTAEAVMAMALASRGARWPICLRDYGGNYKLNLEQQPFTVANGKTTALLQRTFSTTSRSFIQRILFIDQEEVPFQIFVNGSPLGTGISWSINDFGILVIDEVISGNATLRVTGHYLIPVVFQDDGITMTLHTNQTFSIQNVHFREVLEAELIELLAS